LTVAKWRTLQASDPVLPRFEVFYSLLSVVHTQPTSVSVIIPNYNYEDFLAQAIDSALALDWPGIEVIVVDDGSTDGSRRVIAEYGERITAIHQANAGQRAACNAGFARSTGELVIFLDSDDVLDPSLVREVMRVWRPGVSKVQVQMKVIDAEGRATGAVLPQFHVVPDARQIRRWASTAASYPTPPGSGNAYARSYLSQIFPLSGEDRAADSSCLAAAPFLGDVLTIAKPLVAYRVHGRNDGAVSQLDRPRFAVELKRARGLFRQSQSAARSVGIEISDSALDRSLNFLPYRLASWKLLPETHPVAEDSRRKILHDLLAACFVPQGVPGRSRATLMAWAVSVAFAPEPISDRLLLWRFSSASRPQGLKRALQTLRVIKRYEQAPNSGGRP
jgi:glycosyltransferase involved in cell wall biosynthesis